MKEGGVVGGMVAIWRGQPGLHVDSTYINLNIQHKVALAGGLVGYISIP